MSQSCRVLSYAVHHQVIEKQSHDRVFNGVRPPRIGCIDADLPICANGVGVKSQDVRYLYYIFTGSRLRQMPGHFLNDVKKKLHERYLAFWCSNYRNLHPVCPMKMQNSDGLQILHSGLSRNRDSFKQNNKSKLLQSSFWCCRMAFSLPALSPQLVRRYPPSPWVHLTQAWCLSLAYQIRRQWCLRH